MHLSKVGAFFFSTNEQGSRKMTRLFFLLSYIQCARDRVHHFSMSWIRRLFLFWRKVKS